MGFIAEVTLTMVKYYKHNVFLQKPVHLLNWQRLILRKKEKRQVLA